MNLVTAAEMRDLDQQATARFGIPGLLLMENAGLSIVKEVLSRFLPEPETKRVLILAGPGNNGGDGLVVGRHLHNLGVKVQIVLTAEPSSYRGDAAVNLSIVRLMGIDCRVLEADRFDRLSQLLREADLVIDALFGTGFRGVPGEPLASLIRMVNLSGKPVVAVDLPSGMEADSGRVAGDCIRAVLTVTMGLPKVGLYLEPGASYTGEVVVGDISFPPELRCYDSGYHLLDRDMAADSLPPRLPEHHKGSYGHVVVIGGTRGYTGAAVLAGNAALRSGAGLVTVVVPASLYPIAATKLTEVMTRPAPEADGGFAADALKDLDELLGKATVLAVGPGLGQHPETGRFLKDLLRKIGLPVVIDADALNLLARERGVLEDQSLLERRKNWILTPHPGEMARLMGTSIEEVQSDRLGLARQASRNWWVTVVLKGAKTVIASTAETMINPTGNPGLASGGTGDVLTGLIAGLVAQGLSPARAAGVGAYVHGLAADRIAARKGMPGLAAGDLLEEIPLVMKDLYQHKQQKAMISL